MILYCATSNQEKLKEFRLVLGEVQTLPELDRIIPPEETGVTFEENAALKAAYYSRLCDGPVFSEDSGLEVPALGGEPGVHSARYAGEGATDDANIELLLARMRGEKRREAKFVSVIALAQAGEIEKTFRGEVHGLLTEEPRGRNGFGYDPLFFYPPFGSTFGEAERVRKSEVSHRAKALLLLASYWKAKYPA